MTSTERNRLIMIGYWSGPDTSGGWPSAADFVDEGWDADDRSLIANYLRGGHVAWAFMGWSRCRMCDQNNGDLELTDGTYLWPSGLVHYVEDHGVRLPGPFVEHVQSRMNDLEQAERDGAWWGSARPEARTATSASVRRDAGEDPGDVVSDTQVARSVAPLCPRCKQGQVYPAKIAMTGELVQVCEECEASWDASEVLAVVRFRQLDTLFEERGLSSLFDEFETPALGFLGPQRGGLRTWEPPRPVLVTGTVTRHEHYGFYLDIGVEQDGLVVITAIEDDPSAPAELPQVGRVVQAALLGRTGLNAQPRLSVRPADLVAARRARRASPSYFATGGAAEPELVLPEDFDDCGWEVEAKGCFLDATVRWSGRDFTVSFYDPVRLTQDVSADLEGSTQTTFARLVVLPRLTRETMAAAARGLPADFFDTSGT